MAESPSLYARPTVPSTAQALSELAVEEMAVTHALSDRLARKKSRGECVTREVTIPMPTSRARYNPKTVRMLPVSSVMRRFPPQAGDQETNRETKLL